MAVAANKRSIMTLYSSNDPYSHQVRIVLAEKGVTADVIHVDPERIPSDLSGINPYGLVPTLIDRDLVLYKAGIIMEYLDERFPHPPLLPVYPVARAKSRLMMFRIQHDWYELMHKIQQGDEAIVKSARKHLLDSLVSVAPLFGDMPYFLSEEFSLVDCCLAPLLWRLPILGVELPAQAKMIKAYADRVFKRPSFVASLSDAEHELRA